VIFDLGFALLHLHERPIASSVLLNVRLFTLLALRASLLEGSGVPVNATRQLTGVHVNLLTILFTSKSLQKLVLWVS